MHRAAAMTAIALVCALNAYAVTPSKPLDLSRAVVVAPATTGVPAKAADMLVEEIAARSEITLQRSEHFNPTQATIVLGTSKALTKAGLSLPPGLTVPQAAEGYALHIEADIVYAVGHDDRGVLFATGRLLRLLRMQLGSVTLPRVAPISTSPKYPIRGHQLGYRYTANSWDSWTADQFEQYIRDLAAFGTNAIELIPTFDPAEKNSPHMVETMWTMNQKIARITDSYGLDVWCWVPLMAEIDTPDHAQQELQRWRHVFENLSPIHHVLVPGGDPGDTPPEILLPWMERMAGVLRESHPEAGVWLTNQGFSHAMNDYLYRYLTEQQPAWLTGLGYGPWAKQSLPEMRRRLPKHYKIHRYSDITHNVRCQYPIPEWAPAFAHTLGREASNPRPRGMTHIHNRFAPLTDGFCTYSDGVHDDFNKVLWSVLGWAPETAPSAIATEYARYFMDDTLAQPIATGIQALEDNWQGPGIDHTHVENTLFHWQRIDMRADDRAKRTWRYQMALLRAYYDAYQAVRARHDTVLEEAALTKLRTAGEVGPRSAIAAARAVFHESKYPPSVGTLREKILELGAALNESVGLQASVPLYQAANAERGAVLDFLDRPLNNRLWLEAQFDAILTLDDRVEQRRRLAAIANWDQPGPGGFYDDLGNGARQPHLVRQQTWEIDPGFVASPQEEYMNDLPKFGDSPEGAPRWENPWRQSWLNQAQTLYGTPLQMRYTDLDPSARYRLRVTYTGRFNAAMRLTANGTHEIHGPVKGTAEPTPLEYPIPREATADGALELQWDLLEGRGCQVAEVWLLRE